MNITPCQNDTKHTQNSNLKKYFGRQQKNDKILEAWSCHSAVCMYTLQMVGGFAWERKSISHPFKGLWMIKCFDSRSIFCLPTHRWEFGCLITEEKYSIILCISTI